MNKIFLYNGDITHLEVDAIVNAANNSLLGGGGVDGAIHRVAGKKLLEECKTLKGCETGDAKITRAYNLPSKFVIHTVGPVWSENKSDCNFLLKSAYERSLKLAVENNARTIAFPNISTGIYNFPKEDAAEIAINTVKEFLENDKQLKKIIFVVFDDENYRIYKGKYNIELLKN